MNKIFLLICIVTLSGCLYGYGQKKFDLLIETNGKNIESISLHLPLDSIFYDTIYHDEVIKKTENLFLCRGRVNFPYLFELEIDSLHHSQPFIVYPGKNKIKIMRIGAKFNVIRLDQHRQDQDMIIYNSWFENEGSIYRFLSKFDANADLGQNKLSYIKDSLLKTQYDRTDSTLFMFVENNPQSYYGLWYLNRLLQFGYTAMMSDIFNQFDPNLQNSYLGKVTRQKIESTSALKIVGIIPNGKFEDSSGKEFSLHTVFSGNRLTLINFWYSDCAPCIAKLPFLKKLYTQYRDLGFSIVSVSTDQEKDIIKWKNTIQKHAVNWVNLLDVERIHKSLYGVEVFPFSFLVDDKGNILKINPFNSELETMISKTLK